MTEKTNEIIIGELLRQRGWRLAVAESCTGGLIGHQLTNAVGSSTYFVGGIIAYSYKSKVRLLGVTWDTLEKYGAVSQEVVIQMARGARHALAADVGLSVSGIAGPGGGTPDKPVGTTWVGLSTPYHEEGKQFIWDQDRIGNKVLTAEAALQLLVDYLRSHPDGKS
jgi:PncC family amidohydrolase